MSVFIIFSFPLHSQKEEKSQQHKVRNGVPACTPIHPPLPPKPSSPDALQASIASMATISNINIDVQLQQDEHPMKPQSVVSQHHRAGGDPVTHSVYKDNKGRGKPDPSPPPSPAKPPLKSVSGVGSRGADERRPSNGLLDVHPQAEKQMSHVDVKDDTMELLKEADMQNPKVEVEREGAFSTPERRSARKSSEENIVIMEVNMDDKNDTVTLLKGAPTKHQTTDIQVSYFSNIAAFLLFCSLICF